MMRHEAPFALAVIVVTLALTGCTTAGTHDGADSKTGGADMERDVFETTKGELGITFVGHGTLMIDFDGKTIHVDPFGKLTDYAGLPDADLVLITHEHHDHLDAEALAKIRTDETAVVISGSCASQVAGGIVMKNGESKTVAGIDVIAVPAYNVAHKRPSGDPFHPKGVGNGYVLTLGDRKIYVGGDTENIPEMADLENIDVAFLPVNLPYTMTPQMAADAAKSFMPKVLYPYHFGKTDTNELVELLKDTPQIEVRVRNMQ